MPAAMGPEGYVAWSQSGAAAASLCHAAGKTGLA